MVESLQRSQTEQREFTRALTVRVILEWNNQYLLLQKGPNSKAPGLWEFPGGKIEGGLVVGDSAKNLTKIKRAGINESREEARLDLSGVSLVLHDAFDYLLPQHVDSGIASRKSENGNPNNDCHFLITVA